MSVTLATIAADAGIAVPEGADPERLFHATASLALAGGRDIAVQADGGDVAALAATRAGACFVAPSDLAQVPPHTLALVTEDPGAAFVRAAGMLGPRVGAAPPTRPGGIDPRAIVHPEARLEPDVTIESGAVVGPDVEIGGGTTIGANSVVGAGVRIGRGCVIEAHVSIRDALVGDRVVIQAGAQLGAAGPRSVSFGRVIVQDDVEIGAGAIVERGVSDDTTLGERARLEARAVVPADTTVPRCTRVGAFS